MQRHTVKDGLRSAKGIRRSSSLRAARGRSGRDDWEVDDKSAKSQVKRGEGEKKNIPSMELQLGVAGVARRTAGRGNRRKGTAAGSVAKRTARTVSREGGSVRRTNAGMWEDKKGRDGAGALTGRSEGSRIDRGTVGGAGRLRRIHGNGGRTRGDVVELAAR